MTIQQIDWATVDPRDRRIATADVFVSRERTDRISRVFDKIRRDTADHAEATCVILKGEQGTGKSGFLKHYESVHRAGRVDGSYVRPVVYVSLQSATTTLGVAKILLKKLMGDTHLSGTHVDLTIRVKTQIEQQKVQLILIDEFHHVVEMGGKHTISKCADWVKELVKTTGISLCMCGIPKVESIVEANAQLRSITPYRFKLEQYEYEVPQDRLAFRRFLAQLDHALPFNKPCGLGDLDMSLALFAITQGNLRTLIRLVRENPRMSRSIDARRPSLFPT